MKNLLSGFLMVLIALILSALLAWFNLPSIMQHLLTLPAFTAKAGTSHIERVVMRDGTELKTQVYLPRGDESWPAILIRDPYGYAGKLNCRLLVRYGYACVHQDVRGRFGSGGEWAPFVNERHDGADTLQWLIAQPWQNGNIALFGASYLGIAQWAVIDQLPPEVKTIIADVSHGDIYELLYRRGNFIHGILSFWALGMHGNTKHFEDLAGHRPAINSASRFLDPFQPWYVDYISNHEKSSPYWQRGSFAEMRETVVNARIPVLMMGGWHDFFIEGQFRDFLRLPTMDESLLAVRHGGHGWFSGAGALGLPRRALGQFELNTQLNWLAQHLKGESPASPGAGYLLQDNLDGGMRHYTHWPPATVPGQFYLADLDEAGRCDGGTLRRDPPSAVTPVSYNYDPDKPVPSRGGSRILSPKHANVVDQKSDLCARDDVLSFRSEIFPEGLHISGSGTIQLRVSSSANDTAFTVKLQEKLADGRVLNIRDDIVSLRYRNGEMEPVDYPADAVVDIDIALIPIDWRLSPGSSLRLDISSSNFPSFAAHLNSAEPWHLVDRSVIARQTLHGGSLTLPLQKNWHLRGSCHGGMD